MPSRKSSRVARGGAQPVLSGLLDADETDFGSGPLAARTADACRQRLDSASALHFVALNLPCSGPVLTSTDVLSRHGAQLSLSHLNAIGHVLGVASPALLSAGRGQMTAARLCSAWMAALLGALQPVIDENRAQSCSYSGLLKTSMGRMATAAVLDLEPGLMHQCAGACVGSHGTCENSKCKHGPDGDKAVAHDDCFEFVFPHLHGSDGSGVSFSLLT
jgi:hypothetical protein